MKVQQSKKLLYGVTLLLCGAGCSNVEMPGEPKPSGEESYVKFNFSLSADETGQSRIQMNPDGTGRFMKGDKIGLYISSFSEQTTRYKVLTYNGSEWMPRLSPSEIWRDGQYVTMSAYFPADESVPEEQKYQTSFSHEIALDQSDKSSFEQEDLLWTRSQFLPPSTTSVSFSFSHTLYRIDVDLTSVASEVADVKIYTGKEGTVDFDGGRTHFGFEGEAPYGWYTPCQDTQTKGLYSAVVFPMYDEYGLYDEQLSVKVKLTDGKEINYDLPEKNLKEAKPGKRFKVTFNSIRDPEFANRKEWFFGIDCPVYPDAPWVNRDAMEAAAKLPYDEKFGWFDATKRHSYNNAPDLYQCWAGAASNMIHWWLRVNEPYSSRYIAWYNEKHPEAPFPDTKFTPMKKESDGTVVGGSKIFAYFTKHFEDKGGFANQGVDWFFSGKVPTAPWNTREGGGFFKGVYPEEVSYYEGGISKERFNQLIKEALKAERVVAYSAGSHVQNIWGAEFDENGVVTYIYNVDNNYPDFDEPWGGASATRTRIGYTENTTLVNYDPAEGTGVVIARLFFLDKNEEALKNFVEQHCGN